MRNMKRLYEKMIGVVVEAEKRFESNCKKLQELNKLLYEYENLSMEIYSPNLNLYSGSN